MEGKGRAALLAVWSPDLLLSVVAPLGLAAAAGTALVIDHTGGLAVSTGRTLADLVEDGPRLDELGPGRSGVAVLASGPVDIASSTPLIERMASRWPAIVVRVPDENGPHATVPVHPLYPGWLAPTGEAAAVWQPVSGGPRPPGPGPVLPRLRSGTVRRLLAGQLLTRSRWVRAWHRVWGMPWA